MKHPLDLRIDSDPRLEFFEEPHKYRYCGEWIPYSMTQVAKGNDSYFRDTWALPQDDPQRIKLAEACRRGTAVHAGLEAFTKGEKIPDESKEFKDWIQPCVTDDFWQRWKPVPGGIEYNVIDPRYSIAGRLDVILQHRTEGHLALADYKTQSRRDSKPYSIKAQLGGYLTAMDQMPQTRKLAINRCFAIWCRPGACEFQPLEGPECITEFIAARDLFFKSLPDF